MQPARATNERKAKLARSYQELLDDFNNTDLKTVGNYHLGRLIGKGSFGKVYLASHKLTNGSKVGESVRICQRGRHQEDADSGGSNRSCSSPQRKMTPTSLARYITTGNLSTRTLPACTRSS